MWRWSTSVGNSWCVTEICLFDRSTSARAAPPHSSTPLPLLYSECYRCPAYGVTYVLTTLQQARRPYRCGLASVQRQIFWHLRAQFVFRAQRLQDFLPEV